LRIGWASVGPGHQQTLEEAWRWAGQLLVADTAVPAGGVGVVGGAGARRCAPPAPRGCGDVNVNDHVSRHSARAQVILSSRNAAGLWKKPRSMELPIAL